MAVYKPEHQRFLEQLRSIANQSVSDWRCLLVVDGEDPEIPVWLVEAVGEDGRFRILQGSTRVGFYRNFERGLATVPHASSWVALADQDDVWHRDKLAALLPHLAHSTLAQCQAVVVRNGQPVGPTQRRAVPLDALMADNQVTGSLAVFRRELLDLALPFPAPRTPSYHDHWLGICASTLDGVGVLDKPLQDYLQHEDNVIGEESGRHHRQRFSNLVDAPAGWRKVLVQERLGWRRLMARTLLDRGVAPQYVAPLRRWSAGRWSLAGRLAATMVRREVTQSRAAALVLATVLEPRSGREAT